MCNNRVKFIRNPSDIDLASSTIRQLGERMRIRAEHSCGLAHEDEIRCALLCEKFADLLEGKISAQEVKP